MKKANETDDFAKAGELEKEAKEELVKSQPYFEKYLELNPDSIEAIRSLKQTCILMGDDEAYLKYKKMEKELRGN